MFRSIIKGRAPAHWLAEFMDLLEAHPREYLIMDPNQVMEDGEADFKKSAELLAALDDDGMPPGERRAIIDSYTGLFKLKQGEKSTRIYIYGAGYDR